MMLKRFELTFKQPIQIQGQLLTFREGMFLTLEKEEYSFAEVSPLPGLSLESIDDVWSFARDLNFKKIETDIHDFLNLKVNYDHFLKNHFLNYNFSRWTDFPSLKWGLCCLYSSFFRKKLKLSFTGKTYFQGLLQGSAADMLEKAKSINKDFEFAKVKIGRNSNETSLLHTILTETDLKLRLDANCAFTLTEVKSLLNGLPKDRIDYVEEPLKNSSELENYYVSTKIPFALDENISRVQKKTDGLKAVILKPTLIGYYYTLSQIIQKFFGAEFFVSSSFESQIGIKDLARLAFAINPTGHHGLDTDEVFLEQTTTLNKHKNYFEFDNKDTLEGPLYV